MSLIERCTVQSTPVKNEWVFPWVTGALMAGVLVVPGAYGLLTIWLGLFGIWHARGWTTRIWVPSLQLGAWPLWIGLACYVGFGVSVGLSRDYNDTYFEAYVPMLLAPFIVNAVVVARPPAGLLWLGAGWAAVLAGCVASYQSLYLHMDRAGGAMNNVIMFGDLSVVFAMLAALGAFFGHKQGDPKWVRPFYFFAVAMGIWASLLSGTKGGWMSIFMLAFILVWMKLSHWHWLRRLLMVTVVFAAIVLLAMLAPRDLVVNRIVHGLQGGHAWFQTGQITDGSVSIRLEMWKQALEMIAAKPWTGWSLSGSVTEFDERLRHAGAGVLSNVPWTQPENDFLLAGMVHGLPGMVAHLCLYFGMALGFLQIRQKGLNNDYWIALSSAGVLLVVLMLEFGLSVVVLGRSAFRHTLIVWALLALGYLLIFWDQKTKQKD